MNSFLSWSRYPHALILLLRWLQNRLIVIVCQTVGRFSGKLLVNIQPSVFVHSPKICLVSLLFQKINVVNNAVDVFTRSAKY